MKQHNSFEIILSGGVMLIAVAFVSFAYWSTGGARLSDYALTARMTHADGLAVGAGVQIAGIKIGSVSAITLTHYKPVLQIRIRDDIKIPADSKLSVASNGINPGSYLLIAPGKSSAMLPPGGTLVSN